MPTLTRETLAERLHDLNAELGDLLHDALEAGLLGYSERNNIATTRTVVSAVEQGLTRYAMPGEADVAHEREVERVVAEAMARQRAQAPS